MIVSLKPFTMYNTFETLMKITLLSALLVWLMPINSEAQNRFFPCETPEPTIEQFRKMVEQVPLIKKHTKQRRESSFEARGGDLEIVMILFFIHQSNFTSMWIPIATRSISLIQIIK